MDLVVGKNLQRRYVKRTLVSYSSSWCQQTSSPFGEVDLLVLTGRLYRTLGPIPLQDAVSDEKESQDTGSYFLPSLEKWMSI